MAAPTPNKSTPMVSSDSLEQKGKNMAESNANMLQCPLNQQTRSSLDGPVAILWDIENCRVPSDVRPEDVAGNIRMALRVHPVIKGAVMMFSAYGDFNAFPRRLREGCQRTGVKLIDVPNGRKDAADKAILVDMFLFALDNPPPSSIMLISGDVDFAPALHILGQRGYTVILVIPAGVGVSSALCNAGKFVWDWPCVAHGEGYVPPSKALVPPRVGPTEVTGYLTGFHINDNAHGQNEEESIVFRGISQGYYNSRDFSVVSQCLSEYNSSALNGSSVPTTLRSHSLPFGSNDVSGGPMSTSDKNDSPLWVQPGDLKYFPRNVRIQKEVEFMRIKQGDASFEKFLVEYEDLAEHSSYLKANPDEEWKCMHFVSALNPKLKNMVAPMEITNFAILVNKCRLCDDSMAELAKVTQQSDSFKRKQSGYAKGGGNKNDKGKKPKTGQASGAVCPKCRKKHNNKPCLAGQGVCYKCGKPGHFARNCHQAQKSVEAPKPQTQGRVYTLNGKEVAQSDDLIKGFFKVVSVVKSRAASIFSVDDDKDDAACVKDPWPTAKDTFDAVIRIEPKNEASVPCSVENGCEIGVEKVMVFGGGGIEEEVVRDKVVVGEGGVKLGEEGKACVGDLQGLGIEDDVKNGGSDEGKEKEGERPTLVEVFV